MRRKTIAVKIGDIILSSEQPVMIQSMLNTPTMDTEACVEQAIRVIEAGGQLVRITAQGVREAENLKNIHTALRERGYTTPISADIHFTPDAAIVAARYVEKVRINPGNFIDKRAVFQHITYTEEEYAKELQRLKEKFGAFLQECRKYGTAVRIGTNHGSLSDRIMSRYGDTPAGMVEATMEYLRVCQAMDFRDVVISLKASDCRIMVDAVRLLVAAMEREQMKYPLHLGVTEAGEGEDGRIRSAVGIGTLLNEGIGDTIRVSLTEAPDAEIPVAKALVEVCSHPEYESGTGIGKGECSKPVIVADLSGVEAVDEEITVTLGFELQHDNHPVYGRQLQATVKSPELIYTEVLGPELTCLPASVTVIVPAGLLDMAHVYNRKAVPLYQAEQFSETEPEKGPFFVDITELTQLTDELLNRFRACEEGTLVLSGKADYRFYRKAFRRLAESDVKCPVILKVTVEGKDRNRIGLEVASQLGGFFLDRLATGLWIYTPEVEDVAYPVELSRNILQSAGVRRYKTEFISCPGCGRTLFDLQGTVAKVKEVFADLDTLKIAVMGCVVNGPGEMGDADFGYVGAGNGKVNLYKGKQLVRTAVPEEEAIEALRQLIEQCK